MKILLVEDDKLLGAATRKAFLQQGFAVDWAPRKDEALLALQTHLYDLVVLDIGLPDGSGLEVLASMRAQRLLTPVLMLTALQATSDRVRGLDLGADDYLTKPFEIAELCARARALHRRSQGVTHVVLTVHGVTLDPAAHTLKLNGEPVDLGAREFSILQTLFERAGRVVAKAELEETLYGWGDEVSSNAIEVLIHRIRKKLGPEVVRTIRGVGYLAGGPDETT